MSTPEWGLKWQSARDVEFAAETYVCTFKDIAKSDDDGKRPDCSTHLMVLISIGQRRNLKSRLFKELSQPIDYTPKYTFKR